jgi:hypothetical protein
MKKTILILLSLTMMISFLVACGDSGNNQPAPQNPPRETTTTSQEPANPSQENTNQPQTQPNENPANNEPSPPSTPEAPNALPPLDLSGANTPTEPTIFDNYSPPGTVTDGMRRALEATDLYLNLEKDQWGNYQGIGISKMGLYRVLRFDFTDEEALWAVMNVTADWDAQARFHLVYTRDFLESINFDYSTAFINNEYGYLRNILLVSEFTDAEVDRAMFAEYGR